MAKMVWLVAFAVLGTICRAQQPQLDSLLVLLHSHAKDDTVRLDLLNDIAFEYAKTNPEKGTATATEAIALAKKLGTNAKLASAYNYMAVNYTAKGQDSVALGYYQKALLLHQQNGNQLRIATTYNNIAISMVNLSNYPEALSYHTKALAIFEKLGERKRMANSLNNIGVIYLYVSAYDRALEYYLKALQILEASGDETATANALTNVGLVYDHLSNFKKSLEYHNRALEKYKKTGDKINTANVLGNMGNVYHDMDSSSKAIELYTKALDISTQAGNKRGIASNYGNLSSVYSSIGNYPKALYYTNQSLALNTAVGDVQRMAGDHIQLGKIYLYAPASFLTEQGIYPFARIAKVAQNEEKAIALSKQIGSIDLQRDAWQVLADMYEKNGDGDKALSAFKKYITCRDSVFNTETKQNITRREMEFEFAKKSAVEKLQTERQQAVAAAEIKRQAAVRNVIIGASLLLLVAAAASFSFYKKRRDSVEKQKEAEFNMQVTDTEMKALRAQMNPHFIFNSLNSIGDYIDKNETGTATAYTAKFAKLMRMILENSEKKEVPLADDLQALELYLQLEQLRMGNKFLYQIAVEDGIDKHNTFIPPLLLQPFVENSIWHGIAKKQGTGNINIYINLQGDMLKCTIKDDGIGKKMAALGEQGSHKKKSFGIGITKARIDVLNRQKNAKAGIEISFVDDGTTVELLLPLETDV